MAQRDENDASFISCSSLRKCPNLHIIWFSVLSDEEHRLTAGALGNSACLCMVSYQPMAGATSCPGGIFNCLIVAVCFILVQWDTGLVAFSFNFFLLGIALIIFLGRFELWNLCRSLLHWGFYIVQFYLLSS